MKIVTIMRLLLVVCTAASLVGCQAVEYVFWSVFGGWNLGSDAEISGCGGFVEAKQVEGDDEVDDPWCADEVLSWTYDATEGSVEFENQNVLLNCCGHHEIKIIFYGHIETYVIDEVDSSGFPFLRCMCMCFYDFRIKLPNMSPKNIHLQLYRHVTDSADRYMVWEGEVDLAAGSGTELINEQLGWCDSE